MKDSRKFTLALSYLRGLCDGMCLTAPHLFSELSEIIERIEVIRRRANQYQSTGKCYNIPKSRRYK